MFDPKAVAVVGLGAIMPDAVDAPEFWKNIKEARYSITDVPADRWREDLYFDPDPKATDKTYSKIGGWVRNYNFEPLKWGIPIPPSVLSVMDEGQKWGIAAARQALMDYGYPQKPLDNNRVAVILGNALAGENHYTTSLRIRLPEFLDTLSGLEAFRGLSAEVQAALFSGMQHDFRGKVPEITEDTMPGELGNIIAGRIANVFNLGGPNFVTDAACASSLAALQAAVDGLTSHQFDAVLTGGVDRNMGVEGFVKFCKIGALSPDGSRPFADGANGFVMGEGTAIFLLKRLADAEKDGDKIYAVIRGIGGSSDGKGKGITAPNPIGQQRSLERAWKNTGVNPASVGLIEAHGTSTRVGDVTEVNSLNAVFGNFGLPVGKVALGSVKSNVGHLKSAAGAAGLFKVVMALYDKVLPPSANFHRPNPNIAFDQIPFFVNTSLRQWDKPEGEIRRAGVSSFGFGGTNFHVVVEEWVPGLLTTESKTFTVPQMVAQIPAVQPATVAPSFSASAIAPASVHTHATTAVQPYRGLLFLGAETAEELVFKLTSALQAARSGQLPPRQLPSADALARPERIVIDYENAAELVSRGEKALKAFETNAANGWQAMTAQGVFRGSGAPGKLAFLFPGQGSQYVNMLKDLCEVEPVVADTFKEADEIMTPILGRSLTSYIYVDGDEESIKRAEAALRDTAITQPAMLTANVAMLRLMNKFGYSPDLVIGHSLGEYAALVAAGVLTFAEALQVVSARASEMKKVSMEDNGGMAAVSAPLEAVEKVLASLADYAVIANINSPVQSVIGGSTTAIEKSLAAFAAAGFQATKIPVSHAFHTKIVAPASGPLKSVISHMSLNTPQIPVVANVTGELYPTSRTEILEILGQQVASPVQFIKGMQTLYSQGVRAYVEVGPKRVLNALATDNLKDKTDVTILATNHPRKGAVVSFNEALCGMLAAGLQPQCANVASQARATVFGQPLEVTAPKNGNGAAPHAQATVQDGRVPLTGSVVVTGAGLGLPGLKNHVFDDGNVTSILNGEQRIEPLPLKVRQEMVDLRPVRLEKSDAGAQMVTINHLDGTLKLAGQPGQFSLVEEFGVPAERVDACDISTQLAIAAGIEALRDAGIPLVMTYRQTSKGTLLPDRWKLPESLADETGVIFASAFPGTNRFAEEAENFYGYKSVQKQLEEVRSLIALVPADQKDLLAQMQRRANELEAKLQELDYRFDRRFVFRILAMGHSQFAEHIGARGPNTSVNAACATTTHAVSVAEDWIRTGRCRRVVIIAGDDVTGGSFAPWMNTGMLVSGASTTESNIRKAALPFDRRRNGLLMGMGAAALVLESEDSARERGIRGIAEVLSSVTANSAFHGTRLDIGHVSQVMQRVVEQAELRFGIKRDDIAAQTMFMSHETYTPARGGSASAEIHALRRTFGDHANQVIIANTKGFTGHTMGVGVEDVVSVKALEYGIVPPIAHYDMDFEPDPDLGDLNLSRGGKADVKYALRLGAGFGSQIAMVLFRAIPGDPNRKNQSVYGQWLDRVTGYNAAELEVTQRTLRVKHAGPPKRQPAKSTWQYGHGPSMWADTPVSAPAMPVTHETPVAAQPATPVQPVVAPVVQPAMQPAPAASVDEAGIKAFVLQAVSEKTGYPAEMLDLGLDLEADLGIDTVKQAELFATIRTHYNIPRREDLRLSEFNTLEKVIGFMRDSLVGDVQSKPAQVEAVAAVAVTSTVPVAVPAAAPVAASIANVDDEEIKAFVLQAVSEKTGYPPEMLDMELDLEADLGIDTVKQAELFATIRTHYNIPRREDLRLSDYNTLTKVVGFMRDALVGAGQPQPVVTQVVAASVITPAVPAVPPSPAAVSSSNSDEQEVKAFVLQAVSEKTGYPAEMLDMDLDLEADLGIDTVKQAELFATIRTHYNIPRREDLRLSDYNTLAKVVQFMLNETGTQSAPVAPVAQEQAEPAAIPAAAVVQPTSAASHDGVDMDEIKAFVLQAVSEKTGYPSDMLDLDLDLEADLGIDTVKQAELFATIRTNYDIPRREDLRLSDYNTLAKVIQFMADAVAERAAASAPKAVEAAPVEVEAKLEETPAPQVSPTAAAAQATTGAIRRRIPIPVLRPRLDLCTPSGVTIDASSRILVVADSGKTADGLARRLRGRKAQVLVIPTLDEAALAKVQQWQAEAPVTGVYYLPALNVEPALADLDAATWESELEARVLPLYHLLRLVGPESFLVCATRMGGLHGYGADGASAPMGGAVSGFAKAMGMERPNLMVKVVDFAEDEIPARAATLLIEETLVDSAVVEVGWRGEQRYGIAVLDRDVAEQTLNLGKNPIFLVSGGTGGITASVVTDLAQQTRGTFYLLGRSELPDAQDPDIQLARSGREALKNAVMQRMVADGKKPTPKQVESVVDKVTRAAATLQTMDVVRQSGGQAHYLTCDVTDAQSVNAVVKTVTKAEGRVDVFIHAAGLEHSRKLENKPLEEVRETLAIKAGGYFHFLKALAKNKRPLKAVVAFTSVAGRFGNSGQADYSAANDLVCRLTYALRRQNPGLKALTLDWSAWAQVGMASRGSIPMLMELAGIEMMQPEQAAPLVYRELVHGAVGGEVLLTGSLGLLEKPRRPDGGVNLEAANQALTAGKPIHVMFSRLTGLDLNQGITLEAELDPKEQPFLKDHALNGIPLLPGVMGIEGFSVASKHISSVLASEKSGFDVARLEDIHFLAPFKFYKDAPRRITWRAQVAHEQGGLVAHVILESTLARPGRDDEKMLHFTGKVYLAPISDAHAERTMQPPVWNGAYTVEAKDIYQLYFHGPAFQVLEGVQRSGETVLGKLHRDTPAITAEGEELVSTPVLVELCMQTAGIWEAGSTGALALPSSIGELRLYHITPNGQPIFASVTPNHNAEGELSFDATVVDAKGRVYLELDNYRTSPLPYAVDEKLLKPLRGLVADKK
ncbi:MAG TPA: beta-ketoacyl synthase [Anaerolineaceae bacterium]|nr:beta-ketoacyl synthase [Anaerolineaceae bacterium]